MLVGVEHYLALAGLLDDWQDLGLEFALGDGGQSPALGLDGEGILLLAGDAVLFGQVLGGDAHVADAEGVGEDGDHGIDRRGVAHAGAGTQRRQQVGGLGHDLDAAADTIVGIAQHDVLGGGDDALEARGAEARHLHGDRLHGQPGLDGGDAGDVGVARIRGHGVADGHVLDLLGIDPGAGDRLLHDDAGQLAGIELGQGTAEGADGGAHGAQNNNVSTHLVISLV